jgi:undecaprenyl-diphosphatase
MAATSATTAALRLDMSQSSPRRREIDESGNDPVMPQARFVRRALMRAGIGAAVGALVPRHRLAAAAGAAAAGAAVEQPLTGIPFLVGALATKDPTGVAVGAAIGAGTTRVWPTAPRTVEELRRHGTKSTIEPCPDGDGVVIVVNCGAGSAESEETAAQIRERLPRAEVIELGEDDDVSVALEKAAASASTALGAVGGDGTISCAAALAHDRGLPLLAVPGGTLNHFARDAGLLDIDDAIDALQAGQLVDVDVADVGGQRTFLNTASFGVYTDLVQAREARQDQLGKWPAVVVSLVGVLRRAQPIAVVIDGRRRCLWLGFVGNGRYQPSGFAPTWREVLDDGLLDLRVVDAERPFARARLLVSVLTGRLGRTTVYEQRMVARLDIETDDHGLTIALDGEVLEVATPARITTRSPALRVYAPHR